ncbi:MAG: hypothetical protein Q8853_02880, partial [Candidatus Phytoplasma australasiaticum]|nr:hypothetical protein [Candidatus Phytoplasma australasiaticum]
LCDLGVNISLMPFTVFKKLRLGASTSTNIRLLMVDYIVKKPVGILYNVLVSVEKFIFPADFVILDCKVNFDIPIIFGRSFLATRRALAGMEPINLGSD